MTETRIQYFVDELNKRGVDGTCPRCKTPDMVLFPGYLYNNVINKEESYQTDTSEPIIRTIITLCENCGYLCQYAQGILLKE